jgi:hypothetical protein
MYSMYCMYVQNNSHYICMYIGNFLKGLCHDGFSPHQLFGTFDDIFCQRCRGRFEKLSTFMEYSLRSEVRINANDWNNGKDMPNINCNI